MVDERLLFTSTFNNKPSLASDILFAKRDPGVSHTTSDWLHHIPLGNTGLTRHSNRERYSKPKHTGERATSYQQQQKEVKTILIKKAVCYEFDKDQDHIDLINYVNKLIENDENKKKLINILIMEMFFYKNIWYFWTHRLVLSQLKSLCPYGKGPVFTESCRVMFRYRAPFPEGTRL